MRPSAPQQVQTHPKGFERLGKLQEPCKHVEKTCEKFRQICESFYKNFFHSAVVLTWDEATSSPANATVLSVVRAPLQGGLMDIVLVPNRIIGQNSLMHNIQNPIDILTN